MKRRLLKSIIMIAAVFCLLLSDVLNFYSVKAEAGGTRTDSYRMQYLEITVPENFIQLKPELSDSDPKWAEAHIDNPSDRADYYNDNNIKAAYFDPETHCTVYFSAKSEADTLESFDITKNSEAQITEYAQTLVEYFVSSSQVKTMDPEKKMKTEVGVYKHPEMMMFKLNFSNIGENQDAELIYGTVVNGMMISFSMNTNFTGLIREELLEKVVSGVHMTTVMTREEYEARVNKTYIVLGCIAGTGVVLMVILYFISKYRKKMKKKRVDAVSEKLYTFRKRMEAGEVDKTLLFAVETEYNKELIKDYSTFNTWFRRKLRDIGLLLVYIVIVGTAASVSKVVMVIGIVCLCWLLYMRFSANEKLQENLIKRYDIKKKKSVTAEYRFYDEYFTLSGINSISEYIYPQIFRVAHYHGLMLLYVSDEHALVIDIEKVPADQREEFVKHIVLKSKMDQA